MKKKYFITLALFLSSCQFGPLLDNPKPTSLPSGSPIPSITASIPTPTISPTPTPYIFKPISPENLKFISQSPNPNTNNESKTVSSGVSAPSYMPPRRPYWFGDYYYNFQEWVVVSTTEATTEGATGTYKEILDKKVNSIISSWAQDARLVNFYGYTDENGINISNDNIPYGWVFVYASSNLNEMLTININSKQTLIIKQTWGLKNIKPDMIKIDSKNAIEKIKSAIQNPKFMPPNQNFDNIVYNSCLKVKSTEVLYELPSNTTWNIQLNYDSYQKKTYWDMYFEVPNNINFGILPAVIPSPSPNINEKLVDYYVPGYASIDAETGEIINLSRMIKQTGINLCEIQSSPTPSLTPTPIETTNTSLLQK